MIHVGVDVSPGTAPALVDPGQFKAAVVNLAINARDAMPLGGCLTLRAADATVTRPGEPELPPDLAPSEYVALGVVDTCTGMERRDPVPGL